MLPPPGHRTERRTVSVLPELPCSFFITTLSLNPTPSNHHMWSMPTVLSCWKHHLNVTNEYATLETDFFYWIMFWDLSKLLNISEVCFFLLLSIISLYGCTTVYLFSHWRTLCWFLFLAVRIELFINIHEQAVLRVDMFIFAGWIFRVELLDCELRACLNCQTISTVLYHFAFPAAI